ncbi:hypothetical protein B0J11DRAFT_555830 [Dendryphion nanum]|uniref:Uncharacterized protein n=1 Tax=Dendryphion nanum TaxID=256645 RepID=A0A9P9EH60_9PLEO|nr:hypothetical protein B0J11DRAFT_555830 [Dendryphion nanum]
MASTNVLITGTNKAIGIGRSLVTQYLSTPNTTVIATVRDPSTPDAQTLSSIPLAAGSKLIVLKLDAASASSIAGAIEAITKTHGISVLDIVIANAAEASESGPLRDIDLSLVQKFVEVNSYGPLLLYQAALPLLSKSTAGTDKKGKFVLISSVVGSLTNMNNMFPLSLYGASKALANFFVKWLAIENEEVIAWAQHPGAVLTTNASKHIEALADRGIDFTQFAISAEQSASGIKKIIDDATKESTSGKFLSYDNTELPW